MGKVLDKIREGLGLELEQNDIEGELENCGEKITAKDLISNNE